MSTLHNTLQTYAAKHVARVLTQLDRDPDSPTYGCFDRNYWHYKMRDFPSSILQQGVFTLEALRTKQLKHPQVNTETAHEWAVASINALSRQVDSQGRVNEYYPFEASYPAAAFGLYAAMRVLTTWHAEDPSLLEDIDWTGLRRLAHHLKSRTEPQAANQFAAGLTGLVLASKLPAMAMDAHYIAPLAELFFNLQHDEGWFPEYGGPDFGYLTVTIDALADYHQITNDPRALAAAEKAIGFLAQLIGVDDQLPWTLNSRNTDYITPYGLTHFGQTNAQAAALAATLFANANAPEHFLAAVDDRYHCHYVFASLVRALPQVANLTKSMTLPTNQHLWWPGCGYVIQHTKTASLYIAAHKGGLVRIHRLNQPPVVDHGWRVHDGQRLFTSNWWHTKWKLKIDDNRLTLSGALVRVTFPGSSPLKHFILRGLAWTLRHRLMPLLKHIMIFRPGSAAGPQFQRTLTWSATSLTLTDTLAPLVGATAYASPRQNRRHVASADSFHHEEGLDPLIDASPQHLDHPITYQTTIKLTS